MREEESIYQFNQPLLSPTSHHFYIVKIISYYIDRQFPKLFSKKLQHAILYSINKNTILNEPLQYAFSSLQSMNKDKSAPKLFSNLTVDAEDAIPVVVVAWPFMSPLTVAYPTNTQTLVNVQTTNEIKKAKRKDG